MRLHTPLYGTLVFIISVILSLPLIPVTAQEAAPSSLPYYGIPPEMTSCFDFYQYGSVGVTLSPTLREVAQGTTLVVKGTVTNMNAHPIVDASVLLRVVRVQSESGLMNGPDVIEDIIALDDISLAAQEKKDFTFNWKVPETLSPGNYSIMSYVYAADRFNLQGLSFTTDVTGGEVGFTVVGDETGVVRFDTGSVRLNDKPYGIVGFIPYIEPQYTQVPVEVTLENTTDTIVRGTLTWTLSAWDGINTEKVIERKQEQIGLHPQNKRNFSYVVTSTTYPVYYLKAVFSSEGHDSQIAVRYSRMIAESARMNDLGVDSYPLTNSSTAYVCMQELLSAPSERDIRSDAQVELIVSEKGSGGAVPLAQQTYTGKLSHELAALPLPLTMLEGSLSDFDLTGRIVLDGKVVDEVTVSYHCDELGVSCPGPTVAPPVQEAKRMSVTMILAGLGMLFIIGVILAYLLIFRRTQ